MGLNFRDSVVVVKEEAVEGCKDSGTFYTHVLVVKLHRWVFLGTEKLSVV